MGKVGDPAGDIGGTQGLFYNRVARERARPLRCMFEQLVEQIRSSRTVRVRDREHHFLRSLVVAFPPEAPCVMAWNNRKNEWEDPGGEGRWEKSYEWKDNRKNDWETSSEKKHKGNEGGSRGVPNRVEWRCVCGAANYMDRTKCRVCKEWKPEDAPPASYGVKGGRQKALEENLSETVKEMVAKEVEARMAAQDGGRWTREEEEWYQHNAPKEETWPVEEGWEEPPPPRFFAHPPAEAPPVRAPSGKGKIPDKGSGEKGKKGGQPPLSQRMGPPPTGPPKSSSVPQGGGGKAAMKAGPTYDGGKEKKAGGKGGDKDPEFGHAAAGTGSGKPSEGKGGPAVPHWVEEWDVEGKRIPKCMFCGGKDIRNLDNVKSREGKKHAGYACYGCFDSRGAQERYELMCYNSDLKHALEGMQREDWFSTKMDQAYPEASDTQNLMCDLMQAVVAWRYRLGDSTVDLIMKDLKKMKYEKIVELHLQGHAVSEAETRALVTACAASLRKAQEMKDKDDRARECNIVMGKPGKPGGARRPGATTAGVENVDSEEEAAEEEAPYAGGQASPAEKGDGYEGGGEEEEGDHDEVKEEPGREGEENEGGYWGEPGPEKDPRGGFLLAQPWEPVEEKASSSTTRRPTVGTGVCNTSANSRAAPRSVWAANSRAGVPGHRSSYQ